MTVKLEAPRGLEVPAEVVVNHGRPEVEVEVAAGEEAGVFTILASPVGVNGGPSPARCRVTVRGR